MRKPNYDNWDEKKSAKEYGKAHGYYGMAGGWIYRDGSDDAEIYYTRDGLTNIRRSRFNGKPVCQGWLSFYYLYKRDIEYWIKRKKNGNE